ncbi:uncharacterized protein BO95DRAFT_493631 [Aspergillus brunneoviolaceus CBS 621.78]|uniref:Uncharacterized protein n=1 Tax=Aspergillus brunneoviolaceus CBS 621.78 TaxID=1450534 RepID=A0ACD1GDI4_9EURO|nr:hypothetical protein BO95DRAFT_493631 [Aspergillus brunneoviolaceus CBS 621.78]RAH47316.1 hypothetical protein BO95DRAFT_493631 [Aspergillus brunneoviolaceus CBS 621.78]
MMIRPGGARIVDSSNCGWRMEGSKPAVAALAAVAAVAAAAAAATCTPSPPPAPPAPPPSTPLSFLLRIDCSTPYHPSSNTLSNALNHPSETSPISSSMTSAGPPLSLFKACYI